MRMRFTAIFFAAALFFSISGRAAAEIITGLGTTEKIVAFTFDGCESITPSYLDTGIVKFVLEEGLPCSLFVSGKFAQRNRQELHELAAHDFIKVENHSWSHYNHMEKFQPEAVEREVKATDSLITEITGRKPQFFRFPAGNYDRRSVKTVESLGYRIVHWTFASGDPDPHLTTKRLINSVLSRVHGGSILIFHINGRGYRTAEALPTIVSELKQRGYRFVSLEEMLGDGGREAETR